MRPGSLDIFCFINDKIVALSCCLYCFSCPELHWSYCSDLQRLSWHCGVEPSEKQKVGWVSKFTLLTMNMCARRFSHSGAKKTIIRSPPLRGRGAEAKQRSWTGRGEWRKVNPFFSEIRNNNEKELFAIKDSNMWNYKYKFNKAWYKMWNTSCPDLDENYNIFISQCKLRLLLKTKCGKISHETFPHIQNFCVSTVGVGGVERENNNLVLPE